jgi:phosphotriesterase-related protein
MSDRRQADRERSQEAVMSSNAGVRSFGWTRRQAIAALGAAVGFEVASEVFSGTGASATAGQTAGAAGSPFPRGAVIRALLNDLPPDKVGRGAILFHEHLSYNNDFFAKLRSEAPPRPGSPLAGPPTGPNFMENLDWMTEEVQAAATDGVSCIVDGGHADMGTDIEFLRLLSRRSGMPIVKGGGYYRQLTYPPRIAKMSEEELVEELVRHSRDERWGAFGEIGTSDEITPDERKMLRAVGTAQVRTGLPIFSHTANGKAAMQQLDIFQGQGVDVNHLVIGHMCCYFDPNPWREVHAAIAKRGAYVGFDRVGGEQADADRPRVEMVLAFLEGGHEGRALLASDFSFQASSKKGGGGGVARAVTKFVPMLRQRGVKEETIQKVLVDNPRRFLAFVPKN